MSSAREQSVILSSCDMNRRTFGSNESWDSLQSTILAGHVEVVPENVVRKVPSLALEDGNSKVQNVASGNASSKVQNLSTVSEENSLIIVEEPDILDMNIDAISNDSVFLNSSKSLSPMTCNIISFPATVSSVDSGYENEGTGYLLKRMLHDMEICLHSTPTDASESHFARFGSDRQLDYDQSTVYDDLSPISKHPIISPLVVRQRRVSLMKKHFEELMRSVKKRSPGVKVYSRNALVNKSRIPVLKKPSMSCSEYGSGSGSLATQSHRSKSESDSIQFLQNTRFVTKRRPVKRHDCSSNRQISVTSNRSGSVSKTSNKTSASKASVQSKQASCSALNTRRSVGVVSSPIKSVQVIRKLFSPSPRNKRVNGTRMGPSFRNLTLKMSGAKNARLQVPKLVITRDS